ncbi:MAG: hypothetical protein G01um101413_887 [Parcubacteria group bacterium Gr01-1014_13]|nr:MAG: hypothetical protein G01um101413_887 [Parcubacteria group bacterium Gr01-1014_13]
MSDQENEAEKPLQDTEVEVFVMPKDPDNPDHDEAADKLDEKVTERVKEAIEKNAPGGKSKQLKAVEEEAKKAARDTDPDKIGEVEVTVHGKDGDGDSISHTVTCPTEKPTE